MDRKPCFDHQAYEIGYNHAYINTYVQRAFIQ